MNWRVKVAAFKFLSALPGGPSFYRFLQEHATKSLLPSANRLNQKLDVGRQYYQALKGLQKEQMLVNGVHLDFGTGWHPTIPLFYYCLGTPRQYLFDIVSVLDGNLIEGTARTFLEIVNRPDWPDRAQLRRLPSTNVGDDWRKYLDGLGMTYAAPYAEVFPSLAGKVDVVTCTQVLMHIPRDVMRRCFAEIHKSLKPGGFFLSTVHLKDLYANIQSGLSKYNHLRYSPESWERWVNSPLMSFNRFKARDYRELLEETKFEIVRFDIEEATKEDLAELEQIPIAKCFSRYSKEELAAKHLFFVARKM